MKVLAMKSGSVLSMGALVSGISVGHGNSDAPAGPTTTTAAPHAFAATFKTKVKRGKHTIRITATNRAGLADPSPAKSTFRVIKAG